jgi:phosphoglucomutase
VREKDGIWAVLSWLSLLAKEKKPVAEVVRSHWRRFGRSYFQRHDYEKLDASAAGKMMETVLLTLPSLAGKTWNGFVLKNADDFRYTDPVDHSETPHAGIRLLFTNGSRIVARLSGTGTEGATLRLYLERYDRTVIDGDLTKVLEPLVGIALQLLGLKQEPTLIT